MNPSAVAFTRAGVYRVGVACTFQRLVGSPPSVTLSPAGGAKVTAVVRNYLPDTTQESATGYSASQVGSISQGDRQILVMADDLAAAGFVLPVRKGDQVLVADSIATPVGPASPSVAAGAGDADGAAIVAGASGAGRIAAASGEADGQAAAAAEGARISEVLVVTRVDSVKRALAGCIEIYGTGVA